MQRLGCKLYVWLNLNDCSWHGNIFCIVIVLMNVLNNQTVPQKKQCGLKLELLFVLVFVLFTLVSHLLREAFLHNNSNRVPRPGCFTIIQSLDSALKITSQCMKSVDFDIRLIPIAALWQLIHHTCLWAIYIKNPLNSHGHVADQKSIHHKLQLVSFPQK